MIENACAQSDQRGIEEKVSLRGGDILKGLLELSLLFFIQDNKTKPCMHELELRKGSIWWINLTTVVHATWQEPNHEATRWITACERN